MAKVIIRKCFVSLVVGIEVQMLISSRGSYSGYGSVYVPWDCDQIILPNTTGCKTQPPSKIFVQQR